MLVRTMIGPTDMVFSGSCNLIAKNKRKKKSSDRKVSQANADSRSDQSHRKYVIEATCSDLGRLNPDVLETFFIVYVFQVRGCIFGC